MLRKIHQKHFPSLFFKKQTSFSSFPQLQTYIAEIIKDERLSDERNELDRFAKKFSAIQQFYEKIELERNNLNKKYLSLSLNSKHPLRDILQNHTIKNRRGFSDDLLALSLDYLSKTFKSFGKTTENFEDHSIIELHQNTRFADMAEDVKFSLKPGVYSSFENLSKIAESLYKLEYKDLDIQNLMFEKIIRFLKKENEEFIMSLENPFDNFQAIKKYYYENIMDIGEISNNEKFLQKLDKIIQLEERLDDPQTVKLEKIEIPKNESEASDDMIPLLLSSLSNLLSSRQFSIRSLIKTISSIRSYYLKMRKIAENDETISKNSNAQARILKLEEKLIDIGILNVDDIKYAEKMEDEQENTKRVGDIIVDLLKSEVDQEDQFFIKNLIENDLKQISQKKESKKIDFYAEELRLKGEYMGHLLIYLGEIAKLPFRELKKRDFVEEKWKDLLDKPLPKDIQESLIVSNIEYRAFEIDPIYSPIYLSTVKHFQEIFPLLKERILEINTLEGLSKISLAYSSLGLSEESNFFLSKINESAIPEIQSFSLKSFKYLLKALTQSYEKNELANNFIFNYVQTNCLDFDLETAIRSLIILSSFKNDGVSLKKLMTCAFDRLEDEFEVYQTEGDLKQLMFDFRMLVESDLLGFKELSSKRNLNFYFSGIENFEFEDSSNIALKNPMVKEFMTLLQEKYPYLNDFSSFHQKAFAYFNQLYHPQFFSTRFDEKSLQFKKKAVFLLPTGHHSIEGDQSKIPLIWQTRFSIIEKMFPNIECDFIPALKLFNVDFAKGKLVLKNIGESTDWIVKKLILDNRAPFLEKLHLFCESYIVFYKSIAEEISTKENDKAIFLKIFTHCVNLSTFLTKLSQQETEALTSFYLASIKYNLYQIHVISQKLSTTLFKSLFQYLSDKVGLTFNPNLIENLNHFLFEEIKEKYQNDISEKGSHDLWLGRRLSSSLIPTTEHKKDISYEMVNLFFYSDHRYHQYPYWEALTKDFTFNNLSFFKSKSYNNDMPIASIDLDHQPNLGIIPSPGRARNIIRPMSYLWHWEDSFYQRINGEEGNQGFEALAHQTQEPLSDTLSVILSLQNLKYVAKKDFKVEDIARILPKLDFLEDLMRDHIGKSKLKDDQKHTKNIPRNSKDLITFLENPISGNLTNNYISFMMEKFDDKQELQTLLKIKNNQKELLRQIKNGELSLQAYVDLQDSLCKVISNKLQDIKDKNLDQNLVSNLTKKFIDYEFDREELFSNVRLQRFDKNEDTDFVLSADSPDKFLALKKRRAESNLIKLRLIKKIYEGEKLSEIEAEYLNFWKDNCQKGIPDIIDKKPTKRKVGAISENDKNIFKSFNYVDIEVMKEFPLSDLIFEFSFLFNEKLVHTVDLYMKSSYFKKEWELNVCNLSPSFPQQESNWLTTLIENRLWESSSKITENETEIINKMMSLMRNSSPKEAKYNQGIAKITKDFVDTVNPFFNRYALFAKWLDVKEQEIKVGKNTFLAKGTKEKEFERLQAVWKNVFKSEYNETPSRSLHLFAVGLSERMHLIKKFMPFSLPTILKYFFIHPNARTTDKELVVAYLQMFNIEINYDCDDMSIILKKLQDNNVYFLTEQNYEEKMRKASAPFIGDLIEKINKI